MNQSTLGSSVVHLTGKKLQLLKDIGAKFNCGPDDVKGMWQRVQTKRVGLPVKEEQVKQMEKIGSENNLRSIKRKGHSADTLAPQPLAENVNSTGFLGNAHEAISTDAMGLEIAGLEAESLGGVACDEVGPSIGFSHASTGINLGIVRDKYFEDQLPL